MTEYFFPKENFFLLLTFWKSTPLDGNKLTK